MSKNDIKKSIIMGRSAMKTAIVTELPNCYFCESEGKTEPAEYDGRTPTGQWAYMCQYHFDLLGVGLGIGKGQKLILPTKQPSKLIIKADALCQRCAHNCPPDSWNKQTGRYQILDNPIKIEAMSALDLYCEEISA